MTKKETIINFYPDIKAHISPSAFSSWHRQKSSFIKSYFLNEKTPTTPAMKAGKKIHALIENGFLKANKRFDHREEMIKEKIGDYTVLGIPDSHNICEFDNVEFVDYKTGKKNTWDNEKLATDLKMLMTAWLVWKKGSLPKQVKGYLEWIGTKWDGEEIIPTGESEIFEYVYTDERLQEFEQTILNTIKKINEEYLLFLESSDELVSEDDCKLYAELEMDRKKIEAKQKPIKERIMEQLFLGNAKNYKYKLGTFSVSERRTFDYPDDLEFKTESGDIMTMALGKEVELAMGVAKKNYELNHTPKSITKSISFRIKK